MRDYGYLRIMACSPRVRVADVRFNCETITEAIEAADAARAALVVFPELSLTGYTCGDLFGQNLLIDKAEEAAKEIVRVSRAKAVTIVVGVPVRFGGHLYNCAAVIRNGRLKGLVPKTYLPTYNEFYEGRWFASGSDFLSVTNSTTGRFVDDGKGFYRDGFEAVINFAGQKCNISPNLLFKVGRATFGIEICEDFWTPIPPSSFLAPSGAQVIVNISASNEVMNKARQRKELISNQSGRTVTGYVYCSAGYGESTMDTVYGGSAMVCEDGCILAENERFQMEDSMILADLDIDKLNLLRQKKNSFRGMAPDGTSACEYANLYACFDLGKAAPTDFSADLYRKVDAHPFLPSGNPDQVADSTLALLVTCMAFDRLGLPRKDIIGITMPGLGTTSRTKSNAVDLMAALGVTSREISVVPAVEQHFKDIGHDPKVMDSTYENAQARERTQILMDIANQENGLVVGTGDLSELALGWCTYNGDHMSMYGVNASVPKTLIRHLVRWAAGNVFNKPAKKGCRSASDILIDVTETPISPELMPADSKGRIKQKTEDLIGPYELHDFFIYNFMRFGYSPSKIYFFACKAFDGSYDRETILKWLKKFCWRFFTQQFKRSCMPDGPKISEVSFSPRGDFRMVSDAQARLWLDEIDSLEA